MNNEATINGQSLSRVQRRYFAWRAYGWRACLAWELAVKGADLPEGY